MADYCRAAFRNIDNDYRRTVRQRTDPNDIPGDPAKLPDGTPGEPPSEDGIAPAAP